MYQIRLGNSSEKNHQVGKVGLWERRIFHVDWSLVTQFIGSDLIALENYKLFQFAGLLEEQRLEICKGHCIVLTGSSVLTTMLSFWDQPS